MKTNELIYSMLVENTGSHMLDSGGAYGRNHQRNASKTIEDFENEPEEQIIVGKYGLERTISVYHYLNGLDTDEICDKFNELNTNPDDWDAEDEKDGYLYGVSIKAWDFIRDLQNVRGFDVEIERSFNTYNGESDLSQILQGTNLTINDEYYYLIQIHGGCDARGGYTDAKLFACEEEGRIHEYLWEYKHEDELLEDLEEGYLTAVDDDGKELTWEQVNKTLTADISA